MKYERHSLSDFFGDMNTEEYEGLRASVQARGFINSEILILDGKIADGWHRYRVATELEKLNELTFSDISDTSADAIETLLDLNHHRRHRNASQRALSVVMVCEWAENGDNQHTFTGEGVNQFTPKTAFEMAESAKVSRQYIQLAKRAVREGRTDEVLKEGKSLKSLFETIQYEQHPINSILPSMRDEEYSSFIESIEAIGFVSPNIAIYEGRILDGWHRYRAAKELGLTHKLTFVSKDDVENFDPFSFVMGMNNFRQHLDDEIKRLADADICEYLRKRRVFS